VLRGLLTVAHAVVTSVIYELSWTNHAFVIALHTTSYDGIKGTPNINLNYLLDAAFLLS